MALQMGEADAHHIAAGDLVAEAERMQHRAAVRDTEHLLDLELAGLGIELDLGKAHREARRDADAREIILGDGDQAGAGDHLDAGLGHRVDVVGDLLAGVLAAQLHRLPRRLRVSDRLRGIGLADDFLVAEFVVGGSATEHLGGDVEKLRLHVHRGDVHGARLRRRGETAGLVAVPGQPAPAVAALDDGVVPIVVEKLRRHARRGRVREGAEIADTSVDVELAVRRDAQEAVKAVRAGRMVALPDAEAGHLAAIALARAGLLLLPVELLRGLVERLLPDGGRKWATVGADLAARVRRVDLADRDAVDAELARHLVHDRLDDGNELVLAWSALRACWRRVGQHGHGAIAHGGGLVDDRETVAGRAEVAGALMRASLLHDVEVGGQDLAVGRKAELEATLEARPRAADRIFLGAGDTVHHRAADLLRHQSGDRHVGIAGDLAAEATAAEFRDKDEILWRDADQARDIGDG